MPYAQRRQADALNRAYAHVSEASFGAAASALADKLVAMGFDEQEAKDAIEPAQAELDETGLFGPRERPMPVFRHTVTASPDVAIALAAVGQTEGVSVVAGDGDVVEVAVTGRIAPEIEAAIAAAIPAPARKGFAEAVQKYRLETKDKLTPAEQGERFCVPRLMAAVQGHLEFADIDLFMEFHDWSLTSHPARLDEAAFAIRETARSFEIDLDGNRIVYQFAHEDERLALDVDVDGWSQQNLVLWLDRQLRQPDIHQSDMLRWLTDSIGHLVGVRKIHIAALMRTKFILARKLRERLATARLEEQQTIYQRYLFAPDAQVQVSFENGFQFREGMYRDVKKQRGGRWKPRKHFLGADGLPAFDGAEDGEEFQCAQAIDSLPEVKFWLRNVAKHPQSFWLPKATGKFYPDFLAQLSNGRLMIVEYKGALLAGAGVDDTNEKRAVGRLWEAKSAGKGLFVMVEKQLGDRDMRGQMQDKIGG